MGIDKIKEWIPLLSFMSIIGSVIGGIYFFGGFMATVEAGSFTPVEKVKTLHHVEEAPNDVEMWRSKVTLDSVSKLSKQDILDNIYRDSLRDSEVKKNSVTIYQIKTSQEQIEKLVKEMAKQQEHFLEDVHNRN